MKLSGERLSALEKRNSAAFQRYMERLSSQLSERIGRLESLSPLKVLSRGYSLVYSGDRLLSSTDGISVGDTVDIRFGKGTASAEIKEIHEEKQNGGI